MQTAIGGTDRELELRDYLAVIRRRRLIIVLVPLVAVVASLALSYSRPKVYEATAEILLRSRVSEQILVPSQGIISTRTKGDIETEIQVMGSRSVRDAVAEELGFPPSVSLAPRGETSIVAVSARDQVPGTAAEIANTYASVYIDVRREQLVADLLEAAAQVQAELVRIDDAVAELVGDDASTSSRRDALLVERSAYQQQLSQLQLAGNITQAGGAQLVTEASAPGAPVSPTPRRDAAIALAVALAVAVAIAFLVEYLDDTVKSKEDLERATEGLTVLGLIPAVNGWRDRDGPRLVSTTDPNGQAAEAYRTLRTSVQFLGLDRPMSCIQVTSSTASEGKTTTLANLAVALARAGKSVIVVCCDLRRPRVHEFFGLPNRVGFTSVLMGDVSLEDALQAVPGEPRLRVLASGTPPPNPSELLASRHTRDLFAQLHEQADVVLVDSPPVLPVTDAIVLSGVVDATILVGTAHKATRRALHRAVELLRQVDAPLVGSVLNAVAIERGYGDKYGYRYSYRARAGRGVDADASDATWAREPTRT